MQPYKSCEQTYSRLDKLCKWNGPAIQFMTKLFGHEQGRPLVQQTTWGAFGRNSKKKSFWKTNHYALIALHEAPIICYQALRRFMRYDAFALDLAFDDY